MKHNGKLYIPLNKRTLKNKIQYFDKNNKPLTKKVKNRLSSMYIPPAYNNLLLSKSPKNKILLIGTDDAGRKQYIYNSQHTKNLDKRKYCKLKELSNHITRIENENTTNINKLYQNLKLKKNYKIEKSDLITIIIYMLLNYHFRIGNEKYTKLYDSHAISTLKPCHFVKKDNSFIIKFKGKKGVINETIEKDNKVIFIYNFLLKNCENNKQNYLFNYNYLNQISNTNMVGLISSNTIKDYFMTKYKVNITPKMFRTWYANYHMLDYLKKFKSSEFYQDNNSNEKKMSRYLKREIGEYVSKHLNNTPGITKKNYINNKLFDEVINRPKYYIKKVSNCNTKNEMVDYLSNLIC